MNFNKKISKKSFFVTGTDTGVGKTLFCSILMNKFHYNYWKPIQTGNKNDNDTIYDTLTKTSEDMAVYLRDMYGDDPKQFWKKFFRDNYI